MKIVHYSSGLNNEDTLRRVLFGNSTEVSILREVQGSAGDWSICSQKFALRHGRKGFPVKKWTRAVRLNKNDVAELTVDEDDGFILVDLVGRCKLELQPVLVITTEVAREEQGTGSSTEVAE